MAVVLFTAGWRHAIRGTAISVVAPPVVVAGLEDQLADQGLPGGVFVVSPDARTARHQVAEGLTAAVLLVDLQGTTDRLQVDAARHSHFVHDLITTTRTAQAGMGRSTRATTHHFRAPPHITLQSTAVLTWVVTVAGFAMAVGLSFLIGPFQAVAARGVRRMAVIAVMGVVVTLGALPLAAVAGWHQVALAAALWLSVFLITTVTLAVEAVAGLLGLGVVAALWIAVGVPALVLPDPLMLPAAIRTAWAWSPFGVANRLLEASAVYGLARGFWPLMLALVWLLGAGVALRYAPVMRPRGPVAVARWRRNVVYVTAATTAASIVAMSLIPSTVLHDTRSLPIAASSVGPCRMRAPVRDVEQLNRLFTSKNNPYFQGGDVGLNTLLQDGRRLWLFADTLRGPLDALTMVRNSMLIRDGRCLLSVLPPNPGAVIPDRLARPGADSVGYWPMSLLKVTRAGYDLINVTAQRVQRTGYGPFDFVALGPAVAVFVVPVGGAPQLITVRDLGNDRPETGEPMWGAATAVDGEWIYMYGTADPGLPGLHGFSVRVARVRDDDILRKSVYTFWNGYRWSDDADDAAEVIPAPGGTSQTFSVFEQDGAWYALSKQNEFLGTDLMVWKAPGPTGPFVPGAPLAQIPSDPVEGTLIYMPLAHPDLLPEPGTVVVSYSRNDTDFEDVLEDPTRYRPHFLRVSLP